MECWHMSGAGNDFMVVDGRGQALRYAAMAVALCKKTGADGFMAVDTSDKGELPGGDVRQRQPVYLPVRL